MHAVIVRGKKSLQAALDSGIRMETFKHTKVAQEQVNQMFATVSFDLEALGDSKPPIGYADFEFLRDHPYFLQNGEIFCLDYEFALGKLESGSTKLKTFSATEIFLIGWNAISPARAKPPNFICGLITRIQIANALAI